MLLTFTVIGDGSAASSGEGAPASSFPVERPAGLAFDRFGNLFVSSRQTVREVTAGSNGLADADDDAITIYGRAPRGSFPEDTTNCVGNVTVDDDTLLIGDRCLGLLVRLRR